LLPQTNPYPWHGFDGFDRQGGAFVYVRFAAISRHVCNERGAVAQSSTNSNYTETNEKKKRCPTETISPHPFQTIMATNSASTEISGSRKRKLSTKAATNGDPLEASKRQKSGTTVKKSVTAALSAVKKGVTAALTKKKTVPSKTATGTSKAAPVAPDRAPAKVPEKRAQKRAPVEIEDISDDLDDIPSNPPQNPNHILEAANGSDDDDPDPAPELIPVEEDEEDGDEDDEDEDDEDEMNVEAPEESAEAELSRLHLLHVKLS
jgi:hypothetical protein